MKVYKSYTEESLKVLVPQGTPVFFAFPNTFTSQMQEEFKLNPKFLSIPCTCTGYTLQPELEQITFEVKSPTMPHITEPFTKTIKPIYKGVEQVMWEIKFNVDIK